MTGKPIQGGLFDAPPKPATVAPPAALNLIDLRLDLRQLWRAIRHDGRKLEDADDGYAVHCALSALFAAASVPKPFRTAPADGKSMQMRVVAQSPLDLAAVKAAMDAAPDAWRAAVSDVQVHAIPLDQFVAGSKWQFWLHARPTVRKHKDVSGTVGKRKDMQGKVRDLELDAYQIACEQDPDEMTRPTREMVYVQWLKAQLGDQKTCAVDEVGLRGWTLAPMYRKEGPATGSDTARRGRRLIGLPTADYSGQLTVLDAAAFSQLLARGIGRHRAFGLGMLLLKKAK